MTGDAWRIVGGTPLRGIVRPSGSKNGSLPMLAATLLLDGETVLHNVPHIDDVQTMLALLRSAGLKVDESGTTVRIANSGFSTGRVPDDLAAKMRASHYLLGPMLLRLGRAQMAMPGGCNLGSRPVTHITSVLEDLGASGSTSDTVIDLRSEGLRGAVVTLDPRHRNPGATFTALLAGSLAGGSTVVENASYEPDVVSFCNLLNAAGARIKGIGTARLTVDGVRSLRGVEHRVNSDRLEAGTFICAAAATRGEVMVEETTLGELGETADKLQEAGVLLAPSGAGLLASCPARPHGVRIVTDPFPAFSTDLQPIVAAVLATAEGETTIEETVFDRRLQYADELAKMGASISLTDSRHAVIRGVERLRGAQVEGRNIRDGAALVVAALGADGESVVGGRRYVDRGYDDFEGKLRSLGAEIQ
ncbi:MAG: UDP-N-acetylglucosamine 1-carboxyvinyltransferase [Armatimonadota bacterium]